MHINAKQIICDIKVAIAAPWNPIMLMKIGSKIAFNKVDTSIATAWNIVLPKLLKMAVKYKYKIVYGLVNHYYRFSPFNFVH